MGVGKSTLGKKLAQRLEVPFIDSDMIIESIVGMSIADYFSTYGEEEFRSLEKDVLTGITEASAIIATGGGLPCFFDNMDYMNTMGVTIYLERPAKELFQRLKNTKKQRPLLAGLSDNELLEFITEQLANREVYYLQSKFKVGRTHQTVEFLEKLLKD